MIKIGILSENESPVIESLSFALCGLGAGHILSSHGKLSSFGVRYDFFIFSTCDIIDVNAVQPDIVMVSPDYVFNTDNRLFISDVTFILQNNESASVISECKNSDIIICGTSENSTVAVSSLDDNKTILSLQSPIKAITQRGHSLVRDVVIAPCEFQINQPTCDGYSMPALGALLLICGFSPESIVSAW